MPETCSKCEKKKIDGISADMVILITLANIWKTHFRNVIEGTTFLWPTVMNSIHIAIQQHIQEG
jgi:hypothetical protein